MIRFLTSVINTSSYTKRVSLKKQQFITQSTLINLHPNEYNQGLCYYPFVDHLGRYDGICNTLDDLSKRVCVPNKTEDLNLSIFNMITGINNRRF